jgi:hypothetical protein
LRPSTTSIIDVVGTPASSAARFAATLSPSNVTCSGVGPDPHQSGVDHRLRERRVLGEEAVAGVDRVGTGAQRRGDDRIAAQVRLRRRRATDRHGHVDRVDVERVAVGLGVHADGVDAEAVRRAGDPHGNLAAVGDQESGDAHQCLHTPYSVAPCTTLLCTADSAIPITVRESAGWMIPSSHSRPVE